MKSNLFVATAFGGLALLGSTAAFAQTPAFVDVDNNGSWSLAEIQTTNPEMTAEQFARIDANADGEVNTDEVDAAVAAGNLVIAAPATGAAEGGALADTNADGNDATDLADDDASDDGTTTDANDTEAADADSSSTENAGSN